MTFKMIVFIFIFIFSIQPLSLFIGKEHAARFGLLLGQVEWQAGSQFVSILVMLSFYLSLFLFLSCHGAIGKCYAKRALLRHCLSFFLARAHSDHTHHKILIPPRNE